MSLTTLYSSESNSLPIITILLIVFLCLLLSIGIFILYKFMHEYGFRILKKQSNRDKELNTRIEEFYFAKALINILSILGSEKIGSIIVVSRKNDLSEYTKNGYKIEGTFSPEFIMSIFSNKKSALHDGAVIVSGTKIIAVSAYLPMTKNIIDIKYGARHRAALGMSEKTDSIVFVTSETTGLVSIAKDGMLETLPKSNEVLEQRIFRELNINVF